MERGCPAPAKAQKRRTGRRGEAGAICAVLDPGSAAVCRHGGTEGAIHLRLQELRAGDRRGQHCKGSERTRAAARQLCLCGGGGVSGSTEIRHVLAAVPSGAEQQPCRAQH